MPGFEPVVAYGRKIDGLPRNPGWAIVAAWGFENDLNSDKSDQFPKPVSRHKRSNFFLISVIIFFGRWLFDFVPIWSKIKIRLQKWHQKFSELFVSW